MKKQLLLAGLSLVLSTAAFAQKKNVTDAILLMRKYNPIGDIAANKKIVTEAMSFIDLAAVNPETAEDFKMHLCRAQVYYSLIEVNAMENKGVSDAATTQKWKETSVASFKKVLEDPKKTYTADAQNFINGRADFVFNAGIVAYKPGKLAGERSYITIQLMQGKEPVTLKKGLTYCIEYSVSLSESSKFACNNLGAYLSKDAPGNGEAGAIYMAGDHVMKAQVNKVYNGFFGWEKVCNTYTAKGDEKYITIGNCIIIMYFFIRAQYCQLI